ncbi:helicase [Pyrenophora seminiperda CCB06]|uniref:RuvB-like helicase n=1 Tax=Pyrenophora seminiperda CCB06 TaxID=1302712 RepID=A0A3M7LYC5_9PLEO|nr:helicase [Pyrenophora seminiperda CCB06]
MAMEEVDVSPDALALLTKIGQETGLRYASNLITTSDLIRKKRNSPEVTIEHVQRSFALFYDSTRSVKFVSDSEKRLIGDAGDVSFAISNGTDAMDVS